MKLAVQAAYREALFGLWEYTDEFSALGLDPNTEANYALPATAPGDEKPVSVRAAVWLAIEAVPVFPCHPSLGRFHTRGYDLRAAAFRWPAWDGALSIDAVRTAVGLRAVHGDRTDDSLRATGVGAVMGSERPTAGRGYGQPRPALQRDFVKYLIAVITTDDSTEQKPTAVFLP